jgi:hypothetical protein
MPGDPDRSRGGGRPVGGSFWDNNGEFSPPNAQYYAWGNSPGYGYGANGGGNGGGGGGGAPAGGGVPWPDGSEDSVWADDGTFIGDSTVNGTSGSSLFSSLVSRYGAAAVSDALKEYLDQKRLDAQLGNSKYANDERTALEESRLDPFRGYMAQAGDMSRLDLMDHDYTASPVQLDSKYGAGMSVGPSQSYLPSALTRQVLASARGQIASGHTVPTMTNPQNYGSVPVVQAPQAPNSTSRITSASSVTTQPLPRVFAPATPPAAPTAAMPSGLVPAVMSRRRRWPTNDEDQNSPWLTATV